VVFAGGNAVVKWQLASYPLGEVAFGRTLFAFLTTAFVVKPAETWPFPTKRVVSIATAPAISCTHGGQGPLFGQRYVWPRPRHQRQFFFSSASRCPAVVRQRRIRSGGLCVEIEEGFPQRSSPMTPTMSVRRRFPVSQLNVD
jgi:hypothetical protein